MKQMILLVVSMVLLFLLLPVVCVYMILKYMVTGNLRMLMIWAKRVAMSIDVFANIHGSQIFNDILTSAASGTSWLLDSSGRMHRLLRKRSP